MEMERLHAAKTNTIWLLKQVIMAQTKQKAKAKAMSAIKRS
jgi:hypothetical protein